MKNIELPQEVFTKYRLESMGDESYISHVSEKTRNAYKEILSFSDQIPEKMENEFKKRLNALHSSDKLIYENLTDKDTEPIIKNLARTN